MTQGEVAEKIGVSQSTVSKFENGYMEPSLATLVAIADLFVVTVDYLLVGYDRMRRGSVLVKCGGSGVAYECPSVEPPEDVICGYCGQCRCEIYDGETVYRVGGEYIHEDCLEDFAERYFADCRTVLQRPLQRR